MNWHLKVLRRIILSIVCTVLATQSIAQAPCSQNEFWERARANSKEYIKYTRNQGQLKSRCYIEIPSKQSVTNQLQSYYNAIPIESADYSSYFLGTYRWHTLSIVVIVNALPPNASMNISGVMTMTKQLVDLLTEDELRAIMAHEVAHYELNHSQIENFNIHRRKRDNDIIAGFTIGMYAASAVIGGATSARAGIAPSASATNDMSNLIRSIKYASDESTIRYGYKYSRKQEFEADMVAAQFLDYFGKGRSTLISAFKKLISVYGDAYITSVYDTHPTFSDRIRAIE